MIFQCSYLRFSAIAVYSQSEIINSQPFRAAQSNSLNLRLFGASSSRAATRVRNRARRNARMLQRQVNFASPRQLKTGRRIDAPGFLTL